MLNKKKIFKKYTSILLSGVIMLSALPFGNTVKADSIDSIESIEPIGTIMLNDEEENTDEDLSLSSSNSLESESKEDVLNENTESLENNSKDVENSKDISEILEDSEKGSETETSNETNQEEGITEELEKETETKELLVEPKSSLITKETTGSVNIRTGKTTKVNNRVGKAMKGRIFTGKNEGNWFRTTYKGKTVFISNKYLTETPQIKVKMKSNANIRAKGTVNSAKIGYITAGSEITGTKLNNWFRTGLKGKNAYISNKLIDFTTAVELDEVSNNSSKPNTKQITKYATHNQVNIRTGNNTSSKVIGSTRKGDRFVGVVKGAWFETTYKGQKAFISNQYLSTKSPSINPTNKTFTVLGEKIRGYDTARQAVNRGSDYTSLYLKGTYHIYKEEQGVLNITNKKGVPGAWVNPKDNVKGNNTNNTSNNNNFKYIDLGLDKSKIKNHREEGYQGIGRYDDKRMWRVDNNYRYLTIIKNEPYVIVSLKGKSSLYKDGKHYSPNDLYVIKRGFNYYHAPKEYIINTNVSLNRSSAIDNLPYKYRKYVSSVSIIDYKKYPNIADDFYAYAIRNDIFLKPDSRYMLKTAYHETGHAIDNVFGRISEQEPWLSIWRKEWSKLSVYGGTKSSEGFAEAFAYYHVPHVRYNLKRDFPETYNYIRSLINQI